MAEQENQKLPAEGKKEEKKRGIINVTLVVLLIGSLFFAGYNIFLNYRETREEKAKTVKFGLITDVHCYSKLNKDTNEWEINWRCQRPLEEFVKNMNEEFKPDFVIENGDFTDGRDKRGEESFLRANEIYQKIEAPKYHVLGNHETDNITKEKWREIVGYDKDYYYFDVKSYRFIVLDANNVAVPEGSDNIVDMSPTTPHSYKGMMDKEQLAWLENLLKESGNYKKIVFVHEPPLDQTVGKIRGDIFINPKPLRDLFSEYGVMAVFSGHIEEMCDVNINGVRYFTMQGFHKKSPGLKKEQQYKDKGVFHQITLKDNDIKIEMFFSENRDEPYQSIIFNQETAVCNNSTLPEQD
ncbi:MAG: metallophosphoesterase [Candidatus Moranbacteria bacterium]|jgi:Icc-related predicted phosphoesterase|nr:metallophosphoesterase [Candidatus Moranbacteria bacterium]